LINLAGYLTKDFNGAAFPGIGYWVGVGIYSAIGLVGAAYFANRTPREAIKAGIVAPALFLSFLSGASGPGTQTGWLYELPKAYAQEVVVQPPMTDVQKQLIFSLQGSGKSIDLGSTPLTFEFISPQSGSAEQIAISPDALPSIMIPYDVESGTVSVGGISKEISLPSGSALVGVEFEGAKSTFSQQLLWALTGNRSSSPGDIAVEVEPLLQVQQ
jgi:hypothetical protein